MADRPQFRLHASVAVLDRSAGVRVLLVQEAKPQNHGRWNLPGGHVDHAEAIAAGAAREVREETGLALSLSNLLGIYSGETSVRFVFTAELNGQRPFAGDEILDVRFVSVDELIAMSDDELVAPVMLRRIASDLMEGRTYPLGVISGPYAKQTAAVSVPNR